MVRSHLNIVNHGRDDLFQLWILYILRKKYTSRRGRIESYRGQEYNIIELPLLFVRTVGADLQFFYRAYMKPLNQLRYEWKSVLGVYGVLYSCYAGLAS
jgi:hypothetical protein